MPEFYVKFARKISKCLNFYDICPKMPEFYVIIALKIFSQFLGEGARASPAPPSPTCTQRCPNGSDSQRCTGSDSAVPHLLMDICAAVPHRYPLASAVV